jgi:glycerophosphoryl diester phosphodiesterase
VERPEPVIRTFRAIDPTIAPQAPPSRLPAVSLLDRLTHPPRRAVRILLAMAGTTATAAALLIAATPTTASAVDVFGALRVPGDAAFIVGHRGDRAEAPENTMPSLELAMDDLDFVETDVRLSRDGVPVLFHDTTLERVTGKREVVGELDLSELRRLDVGAWYGDDYAGERMPTLDEFLEALAGRETARALVELKADWRVEEVRTVVDLIERHGLRGRVVLQSFSLETLFAVQRVSPTTPRIMLIRELPAEPVALAERLGVIGFGTTAASVTAVPGALVALHEAGVAVLCYTLNSNDHWQEVSALGVDGIITDQPSELDEWLAVTAPGT